MYVIDEAKHLTESLKQGVKKKKRLKPSNEGKTSQAFGNQPQRQMTSQPKTMVNSTAFTSKGP